MIDGPTSIQDWHAYQLLLYAFNYLFSCSPGRDFSLSSVYRPRQPRHQSIRSQSNICFCRNDPVLFGGSRAERKPDVAGVRTALPESGCVGEIICQQSYGRQTRWWTELLLFFEFKLIYKQLLEGLVRNVATRDHSLSTSYHCVF
jgi:hypothetical protein